MRVKASSKGRPFYGASKDPDERVAGDPLRQTAHFQQRQNAHNLRRGQATLADHSFHMTRLKRQQIQDLTLLWRQRRAGLRRGGNLRLTQREDPKFAQNIINGLNQLRSILNQLMTAGIMSKADWAGNGEHLPSLVAGLARSNESTAVKRAFNHEDAQRAAGD